MRNFSGKDKSKDKNCGLADLYFIYADDIYLPHLNYNHFKALLNFYALLYDRILIADSFFINNKFLKALAEENDGRSYISSGIIVPSIRSRASSLREVYDEFAESRTLADNGISREEMVGYLDGIPIKDPVRWNTDEISSNFHDSIFMYTNNLNIDADDKKRWIELLAAISAKNNFTRKALRDEVSKLEFKSPKTLKTLEDYIDIIYNFNIPSFFGMSAAYPEKLMNNTFYCISPQDVFFKCISNIESGNSYLEGEHLSTSFFNTGVLSCLTADQVMHFRTLKEYKKFIRCIKDASDGKKNIKIEESLVNYIHRFDAELPSIINKEIARKIQKEKSKLKIFSMSKNIISDDNFVGIFISGVSGGAAGTAASMLIGSLIKVVMGPVGAKTESIIKKLEMLGRGKVQQVMSRENILDTIRQFSLSSING